MVSDVAETRPAAPARTARGKAKKTALSAQEHEIQNKIKQADNAPFNCSVHFVVGGSLYLRLSTLLECILKAMSLLWPIERHKVIAQS